MAKRPKEPVIDELSDLVSGLIVSPSYVSELVGHLGTDRFVAGLLAFGSAYVAADFVSVFCLGGDGTPLLVGTASSVGKHRAQLAAKAYLTHYQDDIDYMLMRQEKPQGDYSTYQVKEDIASFTYKRDCYERPGIADRRSAVRRRAGYALKMSFYRSAETGEFTEGDRYILNGILPMLLALTERHIAFEWKGRIAAAPDNTVQLAISFPKLTRREMQVLSMTMKGMTAADIADALGIAETTVITHRKKGYERVGVANLRELSQL